MESNKLLTKFRNGEKVIGAFFKLGSDVSIDILGALGFDFIVIDSEHHPYDFGDINAFIKAAEVRGIVPIVRIVDNSRNYILKPLDMGAMGLFIPYVNTADDVRQAVMYSKFPPIGDRGLGYCHKACFSLDPIVAKDPPEAYLEWANENTLLFPQCETASAVENIEEIVQIPGVAGIFIGPADLSVSMGIPKQYDHPDFIKASTHVKDVCNKYGKIIYDIALTPEAALGKFAEGYDGVLTTDTAFLTAGAKAYINGIKAGMK